MAPGGRGRSTEDSERSTHGAWGVVLLLTAIAALMRFARLGTWSVWADEIYTLKDAQSWVTGVLTSSFLTSPLGYLFTGVSIVFFKANEFCIRFFPALFGTLFVPTLFVLVDRLLGRREAIVAALLAAFSPWLLFQSQFARYYSQLLLFSAGSVFLFLLAVRDRSPRIMLASAIVFAFAALTHPTAALVLPAFAVFFALAKRRDDRLRWRLVWPYLTMTIVGLLGEAIINLSALKNTIGYSLEKTTDGADTPIDLLQGLTYNLGLQVAMLSLVGLLVLWKRDRCLAFFLALVTALPFAIVMVLSMIGRSVGERYLIATVPGHLLLAAVVVAELDRRLAGASPRLAGLGLVAALLPSVPGVVSHYLDGDRHDMRGAARFVRERNGPRDTIVAEAHALFALYAEMPRDTVIEAPVDRTRPKFVNAVEHPAGALWVVIPDEFSKSPGDRGEFARWTEQHCHLVAEFHVPRYDYHQNILRVYKRERP